MPIIEQTYGAIAQQQTYVGSPVWTWLAGETLIPVIGTFTARHAPTVALSARHAERVSAAARHAPIVSLEARQG